MIRERPKAPTRIGFATREPSEARDFIDHAYGGRLRIGGWQKDAWELTVDQVIAPQVASGDVRMPADLTYEVNGQEDLVVITVLDGSARYENRSFDRRMSRGDVYVGNHPALHCLGHTHELHAHAVSLSRSLMTVAAAEIAPDIPVPLVLTSIEPLVGGSRRWQLASRFLDDLLDDPDVGGAPLIIGPAARLLALTALAIFPVATDIESPASDRHDAHSETLHRAMDFIDGRPELDITLADIATAANVSPRTIQLAFRRHLDTTPTAYLRVLRMHQAHRQLLAADPGDGSTVTRTAIDWGFASPSRFAALYRAAYGRAPGTTLRG